MLRTTSTESFERKFERAEIELGIPNSDFIDVTVRNSLFPKEALPSLLINLALMGLIFYLPYKAMKRLGNGGGLGGIDSILNVGKAKITEATKSNVCSSLRIDGGRSPSLMSQVWMRPNKKSWNLSIS